MVQVGPLRKHLSPGCAQLLSSLLKLLIWLLLALYTFTVCHCSDITGDCIRAVYHPRTEYISSMRPCFILRLTGPAELRFTLSLPASNHCKGSSELTLWRFKSQLSILLCHVISVEDAVDGR
jgi:hypothetical protein